MTVVAFITTENTLQSLKTSYYDVGNLVSFHNNDLTTQIWYLPDPRNLGKVPNELSIGSIETSTLGVRPTNWRDSIKGIYAALRLYTPQSHTYTMTYLLGRYNGPYVSYEFVRGGNSSY